MFLPYERTIRIVEGRPGQHGLGGNAGVERGIEEVVMRIL